eukprot:1146078-Pelagomonas_calceolata.AAC.5
MESICSNAMKMCVEVEGAHEVQEQVGAGGARLGQVVVPKFRSRQKITVIFSSHEVPSSLEAPSKLPRHWNLVLESACILHFIVDEIRPYSFMCVPVACFTGNPGWAPIVSLGSGAFAGAAGTIASYPFDLIRTTLAAQGEPKKGQEERALLNLEEAPERRLQRKR